MPSLTAGGPAGVDSCSSPTERLRPVSTPPTGVPATWVDKGGVPLSVAGGVDSIRPAAFCVLRMRSAAAPRVLLLMPAKEMRS